MTSFESDLASKFAPTYHWSRGEGNCLAELDPEKDRPTLLLGHPPWKPHVYFSACSLGTHDDERVYEINYLTIWEWDSGTPFLVRSWVGAHQWDTERTAVLVAGPEGSDNPEEYSLRQTYFAAHEGVTALAVLEKPLERLLVRLVKRLPGGLQKRLEERLENRLLGNTLNLDNSCYVEYDPPLDAGPKVLWSKGKHASFPSLMLLKTSNAGDLFDPGETSKPHSLVDAGTWEQPSQAAPWMGYEEDWAPDVSSIRDKLKEHLWNPDGKRRRPEIDHMTQYQVEYLDSMLDAPPPAPPDQVTFPELAGRVPSPSYVVRTTQQIETTEDVKRLMSDLARTTPEPGEDMVKKLVSDYGIDQSAQR